MKQTGFIDFNQQTLARQSDLDLHPARDRVIYHARAALETVELCSVDTYYDIESKRVTPGRQTQRLLKRSVCKAVRDDEVPIQKSLISVASSTPEERSTRGRARDRRLLPNESTSTCTRPCTRGSVTLESIRNTDGRGLDCERAEVGPALLAAAVPSFAGGRVELLDKTAPVAGLSQEAT